MDEVKIQKKEGKAQRRLPFVEEELGV